MSRLPSIDVRLVLTDADVGEFLDWLREEIERGEVIAIDTETNGLHWWTYSFTRLVQFGTFDAGFAIAVAHWGKVIEFAMELIVNSGSEVVMHNAPHDMHALEVCGYPLPSWDDVHDTAILHRLHRSDLSAALKSGHTADVIGNRPLTFAGGNALTERATELGLKSIDKWTYFPVDDPAYWAYGVMDTVLARRLFDAHLPTREEFAEQYQREREYQAIMYRAEKRGLIINEGYTERLQMEMEDEIRKSLFVLQSNGLDNPNSNTQVVALLEEDFGFVPWEFTETGAPSVNKVVLEVLAKAGGLQTMVVEELIKYKRLVKWKGSYVDAFLENRDWHGVVHPTIHTMQAITGHSAITTPPIHQLPSKEASMRKCIKARRGERIVAADYNSQEPRLLCHFGGSVPLTEFIMTGDGKIHDWVAGNLFGADYSQQQRANAKQMGLGRSYGAGPVKMAQSAGVPLEEILPLVDPYDEMMGLKHLNNLVRDIAADRQPNPYIITSGGRRVYCDPGFEFKLVNYLMQGSGADVLKEATIRLDSAGLADHILVPVHDELVFSFPTDSAREMAAEAASIMEDHSFSVPLTVGASDPGATWGSLYE